MRFLQFHDGEIYYPRIRYRQKNVHPLADFELLKPKDKSDLRKFAQKVPNIHRAARANSL